MIAMVGRAALVMSVGVLMPFAAPGVSGIDPQEPRAQVASEVPLPPIPKVAEPVASDEVLDRVYEFAARHQEIVRYVPCFCGCERLKHESVESCFISSRTPEGGVTFSKHGSGCSLCVDVVEAAQALHEQGHSVQEIRRRIVERFYKTRITPTPSAPHQH